MGMAGDIKKGIITIAFDDAYSDTLKYAIPFLDKCGIRSTVAVASDHIGKTFEKRPVAGFETLRNISRRGHEIASHTLSHPNMLKLSKKDRDSAIMEIEDSKRQLEKRCSLKVTSFVFPYIKKNQAPFLRSKAKALYSSLRLTSERPVFNALPKVDPHKLVGFAVMKKHSLSYLSKQVDLAEKKKLWLIEVFHLVGKKNTDSAHRPKPYRFYMHINDFKKHVEYIMSRNLTIMTQHEAVNAL